MATDIDGIERFLCDTLEQISAFNPPTIKPLNMKISPTAMSTLREAVKYVDVFILVVGRTQISPLREIIRQPPFFLNSDHPSGGQRRVRDQLPRRLRAEMVPFCCLQAARRKSPSQLRCWRLLLITIPASHLHLRLAAVAWQSSPHAWRHPVKPSVKKKTVTDEQVLWRRLDQPGDESARLVFQDSYWGARTEPRQATLASFPHPAGRPRSRQVVASGARIGLCFAADSQEKEQR